MRVCLSPEPSNCFFSHTLTCATNASRLSGEWKDDEYDVLADGVVVGRIFPVAPGPHREPHRGVDVGHGLPPRPHAHTRPRGDPGGGHGVAEELAPGMSGHCAGRIALEHGSLPGGREHWDATRRALPLDGVETKDGAQTLGGVGGRNCPNALARFSPPVQPLRHFVGDALRSPSRPGLCNEQRGAGGSAPLFPQAFPRRVPHAEG